MEMTINYWVKHIEADVITDGLNLAAEVTEEQFARMQASYQSGLYEYMNDDESLADILATWEAEERARYYTDAETGIPIMDDDVELVFEYPKAVKK